MNHICLFVKYIHYATFVVYFLPIEAIARKCSPVDVSVNIFLDEQVGAKSVQIWFYNKIN